MRTRTGTTLALLVGALTALTGLVAPAAPAAPGAAVARGGIAPAKAATTATIGDTSDLAQPCPGGAGHAIYAQLATLPAQPSYVVPATGVLTSFSSYQDADGSVRGVVMRPTAAANTFSPAGTTAPLSSATAGLITVPTRIPVRTGDRIALQSLSTATWRCLLLAPTGNQVQLTLESLFNPDDPNAVWDVSVGSHQSTYLVNISAQFEPDADGDGYGDVTQDQCPDSAVLQTPCQRPETTLRGKVKKKTTKRAVSIRFASPTPGATFTCQVDKKAARACSSPFVGKYKPGKHTVTIASYDPTSHLPDATPLVVKFKVVKPKKK
jgi:hypothetical protein